MLRSIFRAGIFIGAASAAVYVARKYWATDFDKAVDYMKSTAKDVQHSIRRTDENVTDSIESNTRKAV